MVNEIVLQLQIVKESRRGSARSQVFRGWTKTIKP